MSAKQAFFKDKLSTCSAKDVYRTINSLLNKNVQHLPYYDSATQLANKFSSYFVTMGIVNIKAGFRICKKRGPSAGKEGPSS